MTARYLAEMVGGQVFAPIRGRGARSAALAAAAGLAALAAGGLALSERGRFPDPLVPRQAPTVLDRDPARAQTAFVQTMGWLQLYAVTLAGGARDYGQHPPLKQFGRAMLGVRTQRLERLEALGMQPEASAPLPYFYPFEALGLDVADLGGLILDPQLVLGPLDLPGEYDRTYIDVAVANSLAAVRVAETTLKVVRSGPVAELARTILAEERCVVDALNEWRSRWYGLPSPEGLTSAATTRPACRPDGFPARGRPRS